MINFTIDGKNVTAKKGETILNVARREGIDIPTMCYLEKVNPIASCRLCVVDVEGVDGMVLSCQTPPTEGINVTTQNDELFRHRQNIMKLYDVNHPLECGVCDKSGACDLQNKTLEFEVDQQPFSAKDQKRDIQQWGLIDYDPSLCIMCEKCVHTCNEVVGDDAIELYFGGYSSSVIPKGSDTLDCTYCGECIAVCPVGALISDDFKYSANAWELNQVPATCSHCSAGCSMSYETKYAGAFEDNSQKIYRVTNDFEYTTLCGAGRFAYDFDVKNVEKDNATFEAAVEAMRSATTIKFNSYITNEEAMILQRIKEYTGAALVNPDALAFKGFLDAFASTRGESLYGGTLDDISASDVVVVVGSRIATDNPQVRYHLTQANRKNKARITYMHPMADDLLQNVITQFINYEVGTEEGVVALLMKSILGNKETSSELSKYISDMDEGYLSGETNVGEEELALIEKSLIRAKKCTLVLGSDLYSHENAANIAKMAGLIEKYSDFSVVLVPSQTNTLGVALTCDLDDEGNGASVGYNVAGDYTIGAFEEANLVTPALNQQEGTFVTINKQVVPTNVAQMHTGYNLNDVANAIGVLAVNTIDYTEQLPTARGFKTVEFDALQNTLDADGSDNRGYKLEITSIEANDSVAEVADLPDFNGIVVYTANPVLHFGAMTQVAHQIQSEAVLTGSEQFATAARVADGDRVIVEFGSHKSEKVFKIDENLKGTIALYPTFDLGLEMDSVTSSYRFNKVTLSKMEK
jgi:NADH-quinone oxidoreductase subunit G